MLIFFELMILQKGRTSLRPKASSIRQIKSWDWNHVAQIQSP